MKLNKAQIFALAVGLIIGLVLGGAIYQPLLSNLESELAELQTEHNTLSSNYDALNSDYLSLQQNYDALNSDYLSLQQNYDVLTSDYLSLQQNYTLLQNIYEELESSSFTYYVVGDKISIIDLEIHREWYTDIEGNITNISDKQIDVVYVYVFARNPDGTIVSDYYNSPTTSYEKIVDLYVGETASFSISYYDLDGDETFEVLLLY